MVEDASLGKTETANLINNDISIQKAVSGNWFLTSN